MKEYRLARLQELPGFTFHAHGYLRPAEAWSRLFDAGGPFDAVINLAARAGVRASVENPWVFVDTNMTGTLNLLEAVPPERHPQVHPGLHLQHLRQRRAPAHPRDGRQRPARCSRMRPARRAPRRCAMPTTSSTAST